MTDLESVRVKVKQPLDLVSVIVAYGGLQLQGLAGHVTQGGCQAAREERENVTVTGTNHLVKSKRSSILNLLLSSV